MNVAVPICPIHPRGPKPMQLLPSGTAWSCPNKVQGPNGVMVYCAHRTPATAPAPVAQNPAYPPAFGGPPMPEPQADHRIEYIPLAVAALTAAQYMGPPIADDEALIKSAQKIFAAMKAML